jgi:DNA-binding MarR family transcriptional regulator
MDDRQYAPWMPPDHRLRQRAWRALMETQAQVFARLVDELGAETGLPMTWYDVLLHLAEVEGGRLRMRELAAAVLLSKSGLTTLVDRMEEAGLVRREVPAGDRRSIDVVLTPAGRRRFEEARAVHRRGIDEHFCAHVSDEEAAALLDLFGRLRAAAD